MHLATEGSTKNTLKIIDDAAKLGYSAVLLSDSKFTKFDRMNNSFFKNVAAVREACASNKMKLYASVCPIGYSNDLLARDANLAEGQPVIHAPFVVRNNMLVPAEEEPLLANGDFAKFEDNKAAPWEIDDPGKIGFVDADVKYDGKPSVRLGGENAGGGRWRISQKIKFKPFRYYHVSVMVKTENFTGKDFRIGPLANGRWLNQQRLSVKPTQDWTRIDVAFNTLDYTEATFFIGTWSPKGGKIWLADVKIEPAGLVNVLRRDGTPVKVTSLHARKVSADGNSFTVYTEGKDFSEIKDPHLGMDGSAGEYAPWHQPPVVSLPEGSQLKQDDQVLIGYYHPAITVGGQVMCCMCEPKVYEIIEWQIAQVHKHFKPDGYFTGFDEIRNQGWDESCVKSGHTPAENLAECARKCTAIIQKEDPGKPIMFWNDMFDPNHNAQKTGIYYLVKGDGPWYGSWKGLPKDAIIMNWHQNDAASVKFFADLGMKQILSGYYDSDPKKIIDWLDRAQNTPGVIGIMYTNWFTGYENLGPFMEAAKSFKPSATTAPETVDRK